MRTLSFTVWTRFSYVSAFDGFLFNNDSNDNNGNNNYTRIKLKQQQ